MIHERACTRDAKTETATTTFRAMGCTVTAALVHDADDAARRTATDALADVQATFAAYEAELSRFLPESGLSRLNAAGSGAHLVSPLLRALTADALDAAVATGGMFDPTLGTVLAHLGYDRPFPLPDANLPDAMPVLLPAHRADAWRDVIVDEDAGTVALPAGVALDFGGIGKGWTVDRVVSHLSDLPGVRGGLVNAGGDLRVWGDVPDGDAAWVVGVEDPRDFDRDCAVLAVRDRAVATSSAAFRRWKRGDRWVHHLLDPRTGRPATTDCAAVTVVGASAMWAEVHAKVALLHGIAAGRAYFHAQPGYDGLLVAADGTLTETADMARWRG